MRLDCSSKEQNWVLPTLPLAILQSGPTLRGTGLGGAQSAITRNSLRKSSFVCEFLQALHMQDVPERGESVKICAFLLNLRLAVGLSPEVSPLKRALSKKKHWWLPVQGWERPGREITSFLKVLLRLWGWPPKTSLVGVGVPPAEAHKTGCLKERRQQGAP